MFQSVCGCTTAGRVVLSAEVRKPGTHGDRTGSVVFWMLCYCTSAWRRSHDPRHSVMYWSSAWYAFRSGLKLATATAQCRRLTHFEQYADEQPDWQGMP